MGRETGIEPRDFQLGKLNRRLKIQTFASMGLIADDPKLWIPQYVRHRAKKGDRFHRRGGTPFNSLVGPDVVRSSTADSGFSSMGVAVPAEISSPSNDSCSSGEAGKISVDVWASSACAAMLHTGARQFSQWARQRRSCPLFPW